MIYGIGTDVVYIPRIKKLHDNFDHKFLLKLLTAKEIELVGAKTGKQLHSHIAKRFAAKEAFVKALGTGFSHGIAMGDIEIFNNNLGKPYYVISQKLSEHIQANISTKKFVAHLSLSDEYPIASAFTIIEFH